MAVGGEAQPIIMKNNNKDKKIMEYDIIIEVYII